jgi:hypothetical protein
MTILRDGFFLSITFQSFNTQLVIRLHNQLVTIPLAFRLFYNPFQNQFMKIHIFVKKETT